MNKYTLSKNIILLIFIIFFSGCLTMKQGNVKSSKKLFETFFVGKDGTQYFIKPMIFINKIGEELKLDITFRYKNEIKDSATLNISLLSKKIIKNINGLVISNTDNRIIIIKDIKHLFTERNKKLFNCRFSTKSSLTKINNMFDDNKWCINVYIQGDSIKYMPTKKTKKSIDKLKETIFILF